jgi:hypothetical protein
MRNRWMQSCLSCARAARAASLPHTLAALLALLAAGAACAQAPDPAPTPKACTAPAHRQFDFWIGRWDVFLPNGNKAGENVIESVAGGCALLESWSGRGGVTGKSLNAFDAGDGRWHQTWVDSTGGRLELSGSFGDGRMVLASAVGEAGKPGDRSTQRITWSANPDGSVRQLWESSDDGGATYRVAFDGRYVKRKE